MPVSFPALEAAARARLTPHAWAYLAGGAGGESTMSANAAAFARWQIVPRVLRGVERRDLSIELLGRHLESPLLLSPIGVLELAHRDADLAVARAAAGLNVPFIFSNQASVPMERCAREMDGVRKGAPRWFQLYWSRSDELVASFIRRAEDCGCSAVVLTLDTTMLGWRPRDLDLAYLPFLRGKGLAQYTSDPVFRAEVKRETSGQQRAAEDPAAGNPPINLRSVAVALQQKAHFPGGLLRNLLSREPREAVRMFLASYSRPSLRWDDLELLRRHTRLPILLKGILHPDDAGMAIDRGVGGFIVSNHGGRQVDGAIASLDALVEIVKVVRGRVPVLLDSGVRGGADVFKALALGATAVCLGRPYVYGLAAAGEQGVREAVSNVIAELDLTLGLTGCASARAVGGSFLRGL